MAVAADQQRYSDAEVGKGGSDIVLDRLCAGDGEPGLGVDFLDIHHPYRVALRPAGPPKLM